MANNNININVTTNADSAGKKFDSLEGSISQTASRASSLKRSFAFLDDSVNSGKITLQQYSKAVQDLDNQEKLLYSSIGKTTKAIQAQSEATTQMGRRLSRSGVLYQQAGYQIGDFIVQVQSGQNAMVAFGQQATQMAGTLTMMGGKWLAIGTGLGIAIPLITAAGAAFMRTRKGTEDSTKSLDTFVSSMRAAGEAARDYLTPIEDLTERYGEFAEAVRTASKLAAQANLTKAMGSMDSASSSLRAGLKDFSVLFEEFGRAYNILEEQTRKLDSMKASPTLFGAQLSIVEQTKSLLEDTKMAAEDAAAELGLTMLQAEDLSESLKSVFKANGMEETAAAAESALSVIEKMSASTKKMPKEVANIVLELQKVIVAASAGAEAMKDMENEGVASSIGRAADEAGRLSRNLAQAALANNYIGRENVFAPGSLPKGSTAGEGITTSDVAALGVESFLPPSLKRGFGGGSGGGSAKRDPLAQLVKRIRLDTELLGVSKEMAQVRKAIANSEVSYGEDAVRNAAALLESYNTQKEKLQELQGIYDTVQNSLEEGFMSMVDGTKSVKDAFGDMAREIIKELYRVLVVQRMVGSFNPSANQGSGLVGFLGKALSSFEGGGYTGSGPRSGGLDGRGGYLAMVHPRETVIDHTKQGQPQGEAVVIHQNFNFAANGDDSVKRIIAQSVPAIVNASKQGVMAARRRGGSMKNTFGG